MIKRTQLNRPAFNELLNWFSPNEIEAGEKYEQIRQGLERYFRFRGCSDPAHLADETITRVASKLSKLDLSDANKKTSIFYGFALNIYREYLAQATSREIQLNTDLLFSGNNADNGEGNKIFTCLEKCLSDLSNDDKQLILQYYSKDKGEKIKLRREIAIELDVSMNALHVRIYRVKDVLKPCIENCLEKNM